MASINLPTATKQDAIKTAVDGIDTKATSIKTTVEGIDTKATTINTNLGVPTSAASSSTSANVHAKLNHLLANNQVVKSIQRGTVTLTSQTAFFQDVTINAVNVNKTSISVYDANYSADGVINSYTFVNETTIRFGKPGSAGASAIWEIIEFY